VLTLVVYAVRKGRYNRLLSSEAYKSQQLAAAASGCSVTLVLLGWEVSCVQFLKLRIQVHAFDAAKVRF
jgi:hypothetical protein